MELNDKHQYKFQNDDGPRQGYRFFMCDSCKLEVKWPTRDCFSKSIEYCPECREPMRPYGNVVHAEWPTDDFGNLVYEDS